MQRRIPVRSRSDRGLATLSYVAMLVAAALTASSVAVVITDNGPPMARALRCAVESVFDGGQACPDSIETGTDGSGSPGGSGGSGGPDGSGDSGGGPAVSCDDVIYTDSTSADAAQASTAALTQQVRVNCIWYPLNPECQSLAQVAGWDPGTVAPDDQAEATRKLADCVTAGVGEPNDNPDDPSCSKTTIMNGKITQVPPMAQVGCREWVVPIECKKQWQDWKALPADASPGDRDRTGKTLQACMDKFYTQNETDCAIKKDTVTEKWEITLLFFLKIEESNGLLVEQLGDGRWRVHVLDETNVGGDFKTPDIRGAEFGLLAMTGWNSDKTFEFGDQGSAEAWVKWYKDYAKAAADLKRAASRTNCRDEVCSVGTIQYRKRVKELLKTEPQRKNLSEASGRSTKVGVSGSYAPSGNGVGGSVGWTGEGTMETRYAPSGVKSSTLTMSNQGAVALLGKLAKTSTKPGEKAKPGDISGALTEALGVNAQGKTSLTVVYNADGSLAKIVLSVDKTMMTTLSKIDPSVSVQLPLGFSVSAGMTYQIDKGTDTVRENVIDLATHPELRPGLEATMSEIFPQDKDGKFTKKAPSLNFDTGGIGDLVDTVGTTRNLQYDTTTQEISGHAGVSFAGLPLVDVKGGKITQGSDLTGSSLDVIDANGDKTTMNPSPKCKAKQIDPNSYGYDKGPPFADRDYNI